VSHCEILSDFAVSIVKEHEAACISTGSITSIFLASVHKSVKLLNLGGIMTNRITLAASEVRLDDHIYNGVGSNPHPTNAWETITEVNVVDGLIQLVAGDKKGVHAEFWFEPEEQVVVIRYPKANA